jgi:4-alpha-glucanotransferase
LLYFTSLPGRFGIGDFYELADFFSAAGQKLWQVLPLNPAGYGDSPYQCFSAFAGNPMLLSLERLRDRGLLQESHLALASPFPDFVDYGPLIEFNLSALLNAFGGLPIDNHRS